MPAVSPLPCRDGLGPSSHRAGRGQWPSIVDYLVQQFPAIDRQQWLARLAAGTVVADDGAPFVVDQPFSGNCRIHYYRELATEVEVPGDVAILHRDDRLLVVDKPHFLPVAPTGRYIQQSLLVRLRQMTGIADLAPLHRLDRETAGVMLFAVDPACRGRYAALFAQRQVSKSYEAIAPWQPELAAGHHRCSHIGRGEPFFRMAEFTGRPANSESRIDCLERRGDWARYLLQPVTGRKHQLRLHMAALGAPIRHDRLYPELQPLADDDFSQPLQLLARSLTFVDPVSGEARCFTSAMQLAWP